ncbi:MAG TPA: glycosyltransferase [Chthoniobacterales bacterium]
MSDSYLILYLGADWWGSDARALAISLRELGHSLIEVNYEDYFPQTWSTWGLRLARRLLRTSCAREFNAAVAAQADNTAIDFVLVFKGMLLEPGTVLAFRNKKIPVYCFYPDVSFTAHGNNISACLPLYDGIFTTKRFHRPSDRIKKIEHVRHGFDPHVHRVLQVSDKVRNYYERDVSFVGCWSPKKEATIQAIVDQKPSLLKLQIWGAGWQRAGESVRKRWQGRGAFGDELALVYQNSKINLGLLSEAASDTTSGDQVTARTWQVPASGGFLLHEATTELAEYFIPGKEVATFNDTADLTRKVKYFLEHESERQQTAAAGYERCVASNYTYAAAAKTICQYHESHPVGKNKNV